MENNKLKKYFKRNFLIIFINTLYVLGLFISLTAIPTILVKEHNVSENIMTLSGVFFSIAFLLGVGISKEVIKYKFNYFFILRSLFLAASVLWIILYQLCYFNLIDKFQYIYVIYKFIDGFLGAFIFFIIQNLLNIKLINNSKKLEIIGIQNTIVYAVKSSAPILSAFLIVYTGKDNILLLSFFITFIIFILIYINNFKLLREYHRYRLKKLSRDIQPIKGSIINFKTILPNFKIFNKDQKIKMKFYSILMIHNSYRNFYDLLFIIFLTKYFEMTLIKASLLISVLILGQSLQVVSSYIYKILNSKFNFTMFFGNFLINIPLMFLMSLFLYIIFTKHNIMNYYHLLLINIFFIGFSRALYASFQEYYNFEFIKKDKKNFSDYEGNKVFFSEIGNLSGYLISTVLLLFYYKLIFYQILIFILLSILISLY